MRIKFEVVEESGRRLVYPKYAASSPEYFDNMQVAEAIARKNRLHVSDVAFLNDKYSKIWFYSKDIDTVVACCLIKLLNCEG